LAETARAVAIVVVAAAGNSQGREAEQS
jgi:hypothetical protein